MSNIRAGAFGHDKSLLTSRCCKEAGGPVGRPWTAVHQGRNSLDICIWTTYANLELQLEAGGRLSQQ